ncbi:MAG: hypothetical protein WCE62_08060 [Polyangiales bacterium]
MRKPAEDLCKGESPRSRRAAETRANKELGPHCYHYDQWVSHIKTALDPHTASDPFFYSEADEGSHIVGHDRAQRR